MVSVVVFIRLRGGAHTRVRSAPPKRGWGRQKGWLPHPELRVTVQLGAEGFVGLGRGRGFRLVAGLRSGLGVGDKKNRPRPRVIPNVF